MRAFMKRLVHRVPIYRMRTTASDNAVPNDHLEGGDSSTSDPRYNACHILVDAGVPCCIWGEDALGAYDVPTVVFDLFLLVLDTSVAATILHDAGYVKRPPSARVRKIHQYNCRWGLPLSPNAQESDETSESLLTEVVLLNTQDWHYELPADVQDMSGWFPPLSKLLESLLWTWINLKPSDQALLYHIANHIAYCYGYIERVNHIEFTELRIETRQLHFDLLARTSTQWLCSPVCQEYYHRRRLEQSSEMPSKSESFQSTKGH